VIAIAAFGGFGFGIAFMMPPESQWAAVVFLAAFQLVVAWHCADLF
jgi:hypothetical protein